METTKKTLDIPCTANVSEQRICDILTNGIEGGMAAWALWDNSPKGLHLPAGTIYNDFAIDGPLNGKDGNLDGHRFAVLAMYEGGGIDVYDSENPDQKLGTLSRFNVIKAISMMANGEDEKGNEIPKRHFADILADNDDAITGDVLLQLAVMGEVVFG